MHVQLHTFQNTQELSQEYFLLWHYVSRIAFPQPLTPQFYLGHQNNKD